MQLREGERMPVERNNVDGREEMCRQVDWGRGAERRGVRRGGVMDEWKVEGVSEEEGEHSSV